MAITIIYDHYHWMADSKWGENVANVIAAYEALLETSLEWSSSPAIS